MAVVGTAEILILADDSAFDKSLKEASAGPLSDLQADAEQAGKDAGQALSDGLAAGGVAGGQGVRDGVSEGLDGAASDVDKAGADIGDALGDAGMVAGSRSGEGIRKGVKAGLDDASKDAEEGGGEIGEKMSSAFKSVLGGLGSLLGGIGIELGPLEKGLDKVGESMEGAASKASGFRGGMETLGKATLVGSAVGFIAVGAAALDLGTKFQSTTAAMAAQGNIPIKTAQQIGKAFLDSGSDVVYSGAQQEQAFTGVVGRLGDMQGKALTVQQSVEFMGHAMDLAEESGQGLQSTTQSLAGVMQTFHVPLSQTVSVTTALFNASRVTGSSVDALASTMDRLKSRMGVTAPTVSDMGSLVVDLANNGITGSRGLNVLNSAMTSLFKPSTDLITAQNNLKTATDNLPPSLRSLASQYATGNMTTSEVTKATDKLTTSQQTAWKAYTDATSKVSAATQAVQDMGVKVTDAHGSFVGMGSIIAQLQPKLQGLTTQQQLATLATVFGTSANKALLQTVLAGPAAYDKAQKAVNDQTAAHHALQVQQQTLGHEFEAIKVQIVDLTTKFGIVLMPVVKNVLKGFSDFIGFLETHKPVLIGVATVIGVVLVSAVAMYVKSLVEGAVESVTSFATMIGGWVGLTGAAEAATPALEEAAAGLTEVDAAADANPIGLIVLAIAGLAVAAYELYKHWSTVWDAIKTAASDAWGFLKTVFNDFLSFIEHWGPLILEIIAAPFTGGLSLIIPEIVKHWSDIENVFTGAVSDIESFLKTGWDDIVSGVEGFFSTIKSDVTGGLSDVVSFFAGLPNRIITAIAKVAEIGGDIVTDILGGVEKTGASIGNWFEQLPGDILRGIGDLASIGEHIVSSIVSGIAHSAGSIGSTILHAVPGGGVASDVLGHFGIHLGAQGGLITSPTLMIAGEAGPEVLVPLSQYGGTSVLDGGFQPGVFPAGKNLSIGQALAAFGGGSLSSAPVTAGAPAAAANTPAASATAQEARPIQLNLTAQTNASAAEIASEVGWALRFA